MSTPADLKYTREHEWVRDNGDGTVTVGITDFAQGELATSYLLSWKKREPTILKTIRLAR